MKGKNLSVVIGAGLLASCPAMADTVSSPLVDCVRATGSPMPHDAKEAYVDLLEDGFSVRVQATLQGHVLVMGLKKDPTYIIDYYGDEIPDQAGEMLPNFSVRDVEPPTDEDQEDYIDIVEAVLDRCGFGNTERLSEVAS